MIKKQPPPAEAAAEVAELKAAVDRLAQEIRVLRDVLDELREELTWGIRNGKLSNSCRVPPMVLTSMPLDPTAPDFGDRINRFIAADLPPADSPAPTHSQQSFFD